MIAEFSHPGIIKLHGIARNQDGIYFVMEWCPFTLSNVLSDEGVALSLADRLALGLGIAKPLQAMHQRGIVHRDVKVGAVSAVREPLESR